MTNYRLLNQKLRALIHGVPHLTANLANCSSLIFNELDNISWAGFYLLENGKLVLNAFHGKPACIEIAVGHGVCGTAVLENRTVLVDNVHNFPGHIACDAASKSEIVVPIRKDGHIFGVLDIDSRIFSRFDENDRSGLEILVKTLEDELFPVV